VISTSLFSDDIWFPLWTFLSIADAVRFLHVSIAVEVPLLNVDIGRLADTLPQVLRTLTLTNCEQSSSRRASPPPYFVVESFVAGRRWLAFWDTVNTPTTPSIVV